MNEFLIFILAIIAAVWASQVVGKKLQNRGTATRWFAMGGTAFFTFFATAIFFIALHSDDKKKEVAEAKPAPVAKVEDPAVEAERKRLADEFRENRDESDYALTACQAHVLDRLKAPASAKFPDRYNVKRSPHQVYLIESYVDSQNSYGAMLRSGWRCKIQFDGGLPERSVSREALDIKILES